MDTKRSNIEVKESDSKAFQFFNQKIIDLNEFKETKDFSTENHCAILIMTEWGEKNEKGRKVKQATGIVGNGGNIIDSIVSAMEGNQHFADIMKEAVTEYLGRSLPNMISNLLDKLDEGLCEAKENIDKAKKN